MNGGDLFGQPGPRKGCSATDDDDDDDGPKYTKIIKLW